MRELALVLAANVVDRQLQGYLSSHGIAATWGVQERIMVCLTPRSNAGPMLHSGRRNARRFHGALLAAYFEQDNLSPEDSLKLEANLALARELEAEVHCLKGAGSGGRHSGLRPRAARHAGLSGPHATRAGAVVLPIAH